VTAIDLDQLVELLTPSSDGLVHGCGCGMPHPPAQSALDVDRGRWERIREALFTRRGRRCLVPVAGSGTVLEGVEVCGATATVAGHVLARLFGGCDRPGNLRPECALHSAREGSMLRSATALVELARARDASAPATLTHGEGGRSSRGSRHPDPAMKNLSLSRSSDTNAQVTRGVPATPVVNSAAHGRLDDGRPTFPPEAVTIGEDGQRRIDPDLVRVPGPDDPVWDAAPWLERLREVPEGAVWPRLMTLPHPRAVGTYGPEVLEVHARTTRGGRLRWWQRLAVYRILEHDADGLLVWAEFIDSTARQCGKSVKLRALALHRVLKAPERWGDQLVLHTARDVSLLREVIRPAWAWAEQNGLVASRNNLDPGISTGPFMTGSRWVLRAKGNAYGLGAGLALVDEGWDVPASTVDEGIEPTTVEQIAAQIGLFSTAHRKATGLMLERRAAAIAELFEPAARLLLEWSPPGNAPRGEVSTWREASPHWSKQRERLITSAYAKVLRGESIDPEEPDPISSFDAQWLNRWPNVVKIEKPAKDEPLVDESAWNGLTGDGAPAPGELLVVALEDDLGEGAAAAAAALTRDGRVVVGGYRFGTRREAVEWCEETAGDSLDALMLVGASLVDDAELEDVELPIEPAGKSETSSALPLLRELVRTGQLVHDGEEEASKAVISARVRPGTAGAAILLTGNESTSLVRCIAWAVQRAHRDRA